MGCDTTPKFRTKGTLSKSPGVPALNRRSGRATSVPPSKVAELLLRLCFGGGTRSTQKSTDSYEARNSTLSRQCTLWGRWGGRDAPERGAGGVCRRGEGGLAGTPLLPGSPDGPRRRRAELKSSWHRSKILLSASNIGRGGGLGGKGGPGGGYLPPTVYGRSNTSRLGGGESSRPSAPTSCKQKTGVNGAERLRLLW